MQNYQAIIIHPSVSGGRCSGLVRINFNGITFESDEIKYNISFLKLSIYAGGAGNRMIFFKDKSQDEISIYTSDKSILKNPDIVSNTQLTNEIKQSKRNLNKPIFVTLLVISIIVSIIAGLYLLKDKMVEGVASQIPKSWEQKAGDKLFTTFSLQYRFIKNDSLKAVFVDVAKPLFDELKKQGYVIDLYFVNDPTINAFALPGGKVVIQSGLIENAKSWEEVMGVLSHELAHVSCRHHIRGVINNVGIYAILATMIGDVSAIAGTYASLGGELASLSNSRTFENEADEVGWNNLVKAKINPNGIISFFEILKKEHQTVLDSTIKDKVDLSFLSTHPDTDERIKHLKELGRYKKQAFKPLPNTFEAFQKALKKYK